MEMVVGEFEWFFTSKTCFQTNFAELTELWRIIAHTENSLVEFVLPMFWNTTLLPQNLWLSDTGMIELQIF